MCGICGVFGPHCTDEHERQVRAIIQAQRSRGPDFEDLVRLPSRSAEVVLGHNRLSIIDLTLTGNQPMWDSAHELCIAFNGEIYNYVELRSELVAAGHAFVGSSDTEVILQAYRRWGTGAFDRFNGMFAFALYDTRTETLYLVRDRFGVKPLYYVPSERFVHFASTPQTLAHLLGLRPDLEYAAGGVRFGLWEHDDVAPYLGMKALLPGHWLEVRPRNDGVTWNLHPYYDFEARTQELSRSLQHASLAEATQLVADTLDDAVRIRLRADVPVAISLSGGLDSCTVSALAAEHPKDRLHGFTYGEPTKGGSEGPAAAELGRMAAIDITWVWPDQDEVRSSFDQTMAAQVGPYISASMMAQNLVFKSARSAGFKVLLGGQGGDEAFMGYHKFQVFHLRRLAAERRYLEALGFGLSLLPTALAERQLWIDTWNNRQRYLRRSGLPTVLALPEAHLPIGYSGKDDLQGRQILDVTLASLPTLLRYEDCNSMCHSIESRLPFLDYRVMELGIALPAGLKLRDGRGKWVVREAMSGLIPDSICRARYKRGFDTQQKSWIDQGLGAHIRGRLRDSVDSISAYLSPGQSVDNSFSDEQLKERPTAFVEATTLLWLARQSA